MLGRMALVVRALAAARARAAVGMGMMVREMVAARVAAAVRVAAARVAVAARVVAAEGGPWRKDNGGRQWQKAVGKEGSDGGGSGGGSHWRCGRCGSSCGHGGAVVEVVVARGWWRPRRPQRQ